LPKSNLEKIAACAVRKFADWMRVVPYWTRSPPAVGLSVVIDAKTKQKAQKFYLSQEFNSIAANFCLAAHLAKRWAEEGPEWADTPAAENFFGMLQRSGAEAWSQFQAGPAVDID